MASIDLNNLNRHLDKIFREKKQELFAILERSRCKNCKHWCNVNSEQLGVCDHPKTETYEPDSFMGDCASLVLTGPEFGCVHFESKESE